jgi:hypothetical protein
MKSESEDFLGMESNANVDRKPPEISIRKRWLIFLLTWIGALVAACPDPRGIMLVPLFPLGLAFLLHYEDGGGMVLTLGWATYLVLSIYVMTSRTKKRFYILYGVLLVLLILNVGGCHGGWKELSGIH